jgi:site-specific recombinase XerD
MPATMQTPALLAPERAIAAFLVPEEPGISVVSDLGSLQNSPDHYPVHVYLQSLAPGRQRTMQAALCTALALLLDQETVKPETMQAFPWHQLRYQHTAAIRARLVSKYSPAMAKKALSAVRGVLKSAWRLRLMEGEDYSRAIDLPKVSGERLPKGRAVPLVEQQQLFIQCQQTKTPKSARDTALLGLLFGCGLRRAEIIALDLADYDRITGELRILGKRNKQRSGYVTNGAKAALDAWLTIRGQESGPLFVRIRKSSQLTTARLSAQTVWDLLSSYTEAHNRPAIRPHDCRRTYASHLLDAGADLATVQQLMGHSDPKTTALYDRRGEVAKQQAAGLVHVPIQPVAG